MSGMKALRSAQRELNLQATDISVFEHAVRAAAPAFAEAAANMRKAADGGTSSLMIELLVAPERALTRSERVVLAQLLAGLMGRLPTRQPLKFQERKRRRDVYDRYRELMAQYRMERRPRPHQEPVIATVAREHAMTEARVRQIVKDPKMR